jgi:hypothetical protein
MLMIVYGPELVRIEADGQKIISLLGRCWRKRKTKKGLIS